MLIDFSCENVWSFKERVTLNLIAEPINELKASNVFSYKNKINFLKSVAVFGANASGKSNLIKAIRFFRSFILESQKESRVGELIPIQNFKLSTETENKTSFFEIRFITDDNLFRYGFEVTNNKIIKEWLHRRTGPSIREAELFHREEQNINIGGYFSEGRGLEAKTRENALFLSVVAQWNGPIATKIIGWITNLNVISGLENDLYLNYTVNNIQKDAEFRNKVIQLIKIADLGIKDLDIKMDIITREKLPKDMPDAIKDLIFSDKAELSRLEIQSVHEKFDEDKNFLGNVKFSMEENESKGTKQYFTLAGPVVDTLINGKVLIIDELDSKLHPSLVKLIVQMFHSNRINTKNAQLVFASHNIRLFSENILRRDQVWFVEKTRFETSDLYSLSDIKIRNKKIRKDASYERDYMLGKYGAIPNLADLDLEECWTHNE